MGFGEKIRDAISNTLAHSLVRANTLYEDAQPGKPEVVMIPFPVSEATRVFLHLIAKNPDLCPPELKKLVETWLDRYDSALHTYMVATYDAQAIKASDDVSRIVLAAQVKYLNQLMKEQQQTDDLGDLEKYFGDEA